MASKASLISFGQNGKNILTYKGESGMKKQVEEHLRLLGLKAKDKVTGFTGIITCISFDLYGCIQAVITPQMNADGKKEEGLWHDISRLVVLDRNPVMDPPNYEYGHQAEGKQGPAEKPKNMTW
jgi:hypothetical protein